MTTFTGELKDLADESDKKKKLSNNFSTNPKVKKEKEAKIISLTRILSSKSRSPTRKNFEKSPNKTLSGAKKQSSEFNSVHEHVDEDTQHK